jgi:hypothetical protein
LRIRRDGGIPASNPSTGANSDRCNEAGRAASGNNCKETFARGFRNPFRMAFDPDATNRAFASTTSVGRAGRRQIAYRPAPTTAGTSVKAGTTTLTVTER